MELQKSDENATELMPRASRVSRKVLKGTVARFVPGSVMGMGALSALIPPGGLSGIRLLELVLLQQVGPLAIGFGLALLGLHRWLYPDSEIQGRRSLVAGLGRSQC